MKIIFVSILFILMQTTVIFAKNISNTEDTYPKICEQVRIQADEDCSEEKGAFKTHAACYKDTVIIKSETIQESTEMNAGIILEPGVHCGNEEL